MGKRMRFVTGAAVGGTIQYLFDPVAGRSRRTRLRDQALARLRDGQRAAGRKLRYQRGRLKGVMHEMGENMPWKETNGQPYLEIGRVYTLRLDSGEEILRARVQSESGEDVTFTNIDTADAITVPRARIVEAEELGD